MDNLSQKKNILVIDDDTDMLELIKAVLESQGFEVHMCSKSSSAMDHIKSLGPHIVILDYLMPDIDGHQLLNQIRSDETTAHICVIIITGLEDSDIRLRSLDMGANDYITKPFSPDELLARLKSHVRIIDMEQKLLANEKLETILKMGRTIGHEINNPLTTILGNAEMLLDEDMESGQKRMIKMIRNESIRIRDLVAKMMDLNAPPADIQYVKNKKMIDIWNTTEQGDL